MESATMLMVLMALSVTMIGYVYKGDRRPFGYLGVILGVCALILVVTDGTILGTDIAVWTIPTILIIGLSAISSMTEAEK